MLSHPEASKRHVLPFLGILLTGALAAGETVSVNVWRDSPGEVLREINHHLPVASRLAWFVPASAELPDQPRPVIGRASCRERV